MQTPGEQKNLCKLNLNPRWIFHYLPTTYTFILLSTIYIFNYICIHGYILVLLFSKTNMKYERERMVHDNLLNVNFTKLRIPLIYTVNYYRFISIIQRNAYNIFILVAPVTIRIALRTSAWIFFVNCSILPDWYIYICIPNFWRINWVINVI